MELQPVILAAGRGNHMVELTNKLAKPLLPIGNKPLIHYPLTMLEKAGFQKVIVITLSSIRTTIDLILKGFRMASTVITIDDDSDSDTLDSLRLIKDYVKTDLLVLSCDFISDVSLRKLVDVHKLHDSSITMLLSSYQPLLENAPGVKPRKKGQHQTRDFIGLCPKDQISHRIMFLLNEADLEDDTLSIRMNVLAEFPHTEVRSNLHDAHVYVMKKWIIDYITHNPFKSSLRSELLPYLVHKQFSKNTSLLDGNIEKKLENIDGADGQNVKDVYTFLKEDKMKDFIYSLSSSKSTFSRHSKQLLCYAHIHENGILLNANNLASYVEANRTVAKSDSIFCEDSSRISSSVELQEKAQIGSDCMVGDRTCVGEKSSIKRSVIGKDCKIGSYVRISNCVLMDYVQIQNGCNLQGSVVAESSVIGEKSTVTDCLIGFNKTISNSSKLTRESIVDSVVMEFD